jgi:hypothetical protein
LCDGIHSDRREFDCAYLAGGLARRPVVISVRWTSVMTIPSAALLLAAIWLSVAAPKTAQAQGLLGSDMTFWPWYPPILIIPEPRRAQPMQPAPPPTFGALPSTEPTYWYCMDAGAYYPDVTQCAGGWQQVVPRRLPPPPPIETTPQGGTRLRPDNAIDRRSPR